MREKGTTTLLAAPTHNINQAQPIFCIANSLSPHIAHPHLHCAAYLRFLASLHPIQLPSILPTSEVPI